MLICLSSFQPATLKKLQNLGKFLAPTFGQTFLVTLKVSKNSMQVREERKNEDGVSLIFQKKEKNCDADFFSPKQNVVSGQSDVTSKHHLRPVTESSKLVAFLK